MLFLCSSIWAYLSIESIGIKLLLLRKSYKLVEYTFLSDFELISSIINYINYSKFDVPDLIFFIYSYFREKKFNLVLFNGKKFNNLLFFYIKMLNSRNPFS